MMVAMESLTVGEFLFCGICEFDRRTRLNLLSVESHPEEELKKQTITYSFNIWL